MRDRKLFLPAEGKPHRDQVSQEGRPVEPGPHLRVHVARTRVQGGRGLRPRHGFLRDRFEGRRQQLQSLVRFVVKLFI